MRKILFYINILLIPCISFGQGIFSSSNESSTLVQTRQSRSSDSNPLLNAAAFKLGETAIDYAFINKTNRNFIWGVKGTVKSNSNLASIFRNGDFVPGYKGEISFGKIWFFSTPDDDTVRQQRRAIEPDINNLIERMARDSATLDSLIDLRITDSRIDSLRQSSVINSANLDSLIEERNELSTIFDGLIFFGNLGLEGRGFFNYIRNQTFENEIISQSNTLSKYTIGINYFNKNFISFATIVCGVGLIFERTDNFKDLKEVSVKNKIKSFSPAHDTITREIEQNITAFEGEYNGNLRKTSYAFDFYLVPNFLSRTLGISFNYQINNFTNKVDTQDINLGLFFIEKKNVFNPSFAINFKFSDIKSADILPEGKSRFSISITKQFNFTKGF